MCDKLKTGGLGYHLIIILWVELYPCPPVGLNSTNFRNKKAALEMRAALVELVHDTIITGKQPSNRDKIGTLSTVAMTDNSNVLLKKWVF